MSSPDWGSSPSSSSSRSPWLTRSWPSSNFAVEDSLGAAFDFGAIGRLATSGPYFAAVVLAIAVQVIVSAVVFAAVLFTFGLSLFVLVPLGPFFSFWVYLVTVYLFGAAYREAMGGGEPRPASA